MSEAAVAEDAFMTVDELAAFLRVDRKTAYAAIRGGSVPGVKRIGRTIRIYRPTVLEWALKEERAKRR